MVGWRAEVWPILKLPTPTRRGPFFLRPVARLRAGVSVEAAAEDLARISARIYPLWADGFRDSTARLTPVPLKEVVVGDVQLALYLLLGAVGFVLLIAVANVANLQLARASGRDHEVAVRTALGARRGRIARQLLVESLLLSAIGGVLGVALAHATLTVLLRLGPDLPRLDEVGLDLRVLGFAAVLTLGSGLIFGCAPLAHAFRTDPADALRRGGRGAGRGVGGSRARAALVVAEFALAVPLLAGAVLLMTSLALLQRVDPGFDPTGIATGQVSLPGRVYQDNNARIQFWDRALVVLGDIPGVERVAISSGLPPDAPRAFNNFDLLDRPVPEGTAEPVSPWLAVSPDFFQTMGIPLLAGRALEASDTSAPVVVVSQGWANRFYPGENPVGRRMISGGCTSCAPTTVVGVVGDVAYEGLEAQASDAVYTPYAQWPWASVQLIVRSRGGAVPMEGVRRALGTLDPSLALSEVGTMEERLRASLAKPRYWSLLLGAFATVGVVLAAVGIYGVLSNAVVRQRRDIGIRLALGAARGSVVRMVVTRGMTQAGIGLALGLAGALVLTRWLEGLLFGVSATDPVTFGGVALGLLIVALAACYGPARGATRVDPVRVLSAE